MPWNFISEISVLSVIPFLIVANPVIAVFGVNSSSEIIAILLPSLNIVVITCEVSDESRIVSKANPFVVPVELGGPTKTEVAPS